MQARAGYSRPLRLLARLGSLRAFAVLPVIAVLFSPAVRASEEALAAELARLPGDDVPVWLEAGGARFLAIERPAGRTPVRGSVLIAHAPGQHADWPDVVRPLRTGLAADGWRTLSVQMPDSDAAGGFVSAQPDVTARVTAAAAHAGVPAGQTLVLIAYGAAYEAVAALASGGAIGPVALVLVSPMPSPVAAGGSAGASVQVAPTAPDDASDLLAGSELALLEVSAALDRTEVKALVSRHERLHARGEMPGRRALEIPAAHDDYRGQEELLVRRVRGWLRKLPPPSVPGTAESAS